MIAAGGVARVADFTVDYRNGAIALIRDIDGIGSVIDRHLLRKAANRRGGLRLPAT